MKDYLQIILLLTIVALLVQMNTRMRRSPKKTTVKTSGSMKTILDTCALIDGRIFELCSSGFVPGQVIVPQFILAELQHLADGSDAHKRERARFGLEIVQQMQADNSIDVSVDDSEFAEIPQVDDKLVALAQKLGARLYTTDYNLNKVADIKGVTVLNVHELAGNLRPVALPGEKKIIKIVQKGSNKNQGVGYLDDGTMVVVDGAARSIGKKVDAEVTRIHQTVAGKMIFAELVGAKSPSPKRKPER